MCSDCRDNTRHRILVVDHRPLYRYAIRGVLHDRGYGVHEAENGRKAKQCLAITPADVVIVDICLPRMDGVELITNLVHSVPEASIIAMSGGGMVARDSALSIARELGAERSLSKPFTDDELIDAVEGALMMRFGAKCLS